MSVITLSAAPAIAQPAKQQAHYDVYAGGFHVLSADLTVDTSAKKNYFPAPL